MTFRLIALRDRLAKATKGSRPFLVACLVAFILEHLALPWLMEGQHAALSHSLFNARLAYGSIVSTWPRTLFPRYTAIVYIDPDRDLAAFGLSHDRCQQRTYIAMLVAAIAEHRPSMIVIDKYFTVRGCAQPQPTQTLRAAIEATSLLVPVVVGLRMDPEAGDADSPGGPTPRLLAALEFDAGPALRQGLVETDARSADRIPLGWTVRAAATEEPRWHDGLALSAALLREPKLIERVSRLRRAIESRASPYASLIPAKHFATLLASDVLCTQSKVPAEHLSSCAGKPRTDFNPLSGRIVVLGDTGPGVDRHRTTQIGVVTGPLLQANYIEALLDERFFLPGSEWLDYGFGFCLFAALVWAFHQQSWLRTLLGVVGVVGITVLILRFVARDLGYFVAPAVGVLALFFMLLGWIKERIMSHRSDSNEL